MVVMNSVAPPGDRTEGGEHGVTLAELKQNEKNPNTNTFMESDEEADDFQPLVIDTRPPPEGTTSMEQDKQRLLRQLSRDPLYHENNPSDTEPELLVRSESGNPLLLQTPAIFPGMQGGQSDSSTSSSRIPSPTFSTTSNSGGSSGRTKASHPNKARRKTDKILPVDGGKYICPICHTGVISNTELTKHIRSHNNGGPLAANTCTICCKVLSSQSSLDRHMLVHSGERPFKCKYCTMSFTTNGNMHRHSRIHEKPETAQSQNSKSGPPSRISRYTYSGDAYSQASFSSPSPRRVTNGVGLSPKTPPNGSKRKLSFDPQVQVMASKRRALGLVGGMDREPTGLSPDGRAMVATSPSPPEIPQHTVELPVTNGSEHLNKGEKQDTPEQFYCPICSMPFQCRYGLDSHLQTHPDFSITCQLCPRSFSSRQELITHKIQDHKTPMLYSADKLPSASTEPQDIAVGFHELDFIDFTCEKFPLIAQAWCDENTHCPSSSFHDFSCSICKKAFPCKASLKIHSNAHASDDVTECQECEIHLEDHSAHRNHMLNHIAPKVVTRVSSVDGASDAPQKAVSKEDYLTCFGLTVSKSIKKERVIPKPRQEDMRINENYFPLLQRMAQMQAERQLEKTANLERMAQQQRDFHVVRPEHKSPYRLPHPMSHNMDSSGDLADIQQILNNFGSGGGLVQIGKNLSASPATGRTPESDSHLTSIAPKSHIDTIKEGDNGMRLPTLVNFLPIQNQPEEAPTSDTVEAFQCKYCPEVFTSIKSYKSHNRTHPELAPYKCSLCTYSSTDKSTLIRHHRTHNGERPFQCRICQFAFTTKANCERHVRKKHMRFSKKDIDDVIGYNQYANESMQDADGFGSAETICKYCGENFWFSYALKYHLRFPNSCARKPFICRICDTGFSTKLNVMRHVQKHHPDVDQQKVDEHIYTNELFALEISEDIKVYESIEAMNHCQSPALATSTPTSFYTNVNPIVISPIPPPTQTLPSTSSSFLTYSPMMNANPKVNSDIEDDQPLDFSMKASKRTDVLLDSSDNSHKSNNYSIDQQCSNDEPMDLSLKTISTRAIELSKSTSNIYNHTPPTTMYTYSNKTPAVLTPSPLLIPHTETAKAMSDEQTDEFNASRQPLVTPKTGPDYGMQRYKKEYQKYYNPTVGRLECPYCKMLFKHGLKLQVHIRSHTNERPFSCAYCSASFTIKTNLERHLKTRHPLQPPVIPDVPNTSSVDASQEQDVDVLSTMEGFNVTTTETSPALAPGIPSGNFEGSDDSNCELSSVTRILDATNSTHFRNFLNAAVPDESGSGEPSTTPTSPFRSYLENGNSNHSSNYNHDRDDLADDGESDAESDILITQTQLTPEEIIRQTTEKLSIIKIRNPKSMEKSPDDGSGSPAKKKRNSYADSPHKLMCPYCPRAFPWISSLNRHILTHTGQKPFKCPKCPVMFSTKSNRERHLVRKHGLNVLDPATRQMMDRPFKCHLCVFSSFSTGGNLYKHYEEKHPDVSIPDHLEEGDANNNTDTYTTECEENLEVAEATKAKRLEFGLDDDDSKDGIQDGLGTKLMDHVVQSALAMTPRATTPVSRSMSPVPLTVSPGPTPTDRHQINPERDNYNVDKITECWKCEEDFGSRKGLLRHLKEHNIDLAFKCYLCDASFDQRLQCLEHMAQRHVADWSALRDKNQIDDITEFADCMNRIVEQNFIGNSNFGKKLSDAELARYKVQLLEDMKPESDYTQRKVYCSLCPKRFWSLQDLRRHMRSHTGERPFECDLCQKRFTLKHSMMRHRRKHADPDPASLSASDDESGHIMDSLDQANNLTTLEQQTRRELGVSKMSAAAANVANSTSKGRLDSDLLHNLLGVEDAAIDEILTSYSADAAARVLGMTSQ